MKIQSHSTLKYLCIFPASLHFFTNIKCLYVSSSIFIKKRTCYILISYTLAYINREREREIERERVRILAKDPLKSYICRTSVTKESKLKKIHTLLTFLEKFNLLIKN